MRDIAFYEAPYVAVAQLQTFRSGKGSRGIGLYVRGVAIVDAWLDEGEDPVAAEQSLRDMCVLRQGGAA